MAAQVSGWSLDLSQQTQQLLGGELQALTPL
jgi:hypothetical protein